MRHGRAKASRRTLQFYRLNAPHIAPPYKILLDGTFLVAAARNKVPLRERFGKTLQHEEFACYVTRATLVELEALSRRQSEGKASGGDEPSNWFARARQYGLDECEILEGDKLPTTEEEGARNNKAFREFSDASRGIYRLAAEGGNNRRAYFVATQDDALADALRSQPFVPLFRLGRAVLLLEAPSSASRSHTGQLEQGKLASAGGLMTAEEREMVDRVKEREGRKRKERMREEHRRLEKRSREEVGGSFSNRKKKRAKGPNPLSCKKKK